MFMTIVELDPKKSSHFQTCEMFGKVKFVEHQNYAIIYSEKPINENSEKCEWDTDKDYNFEFPYNQSVKSKGKRHDLIVHLKHQGINVSGKEDKYRLNSFVENVVPLMGVEIKDLQVKDFGIKREYYKKISNSYVNISGKLKINDLKKFETFLLNGYKPGKSFGLGFLVL